MSLIKSLMGRRQFLIAAGVTSTLGVASKKLSDAFNPGLHGNVARAASSTSGSPGTNGHFSSRYSHLLSPINIGNVTFKNRMESPKATPHHIQGPEDFPNDALINYYMNVAKNGAAVVTLGINRWDLTNTGVQMYIAQIIDGIHFYGSKANVALTQNDDPEGYSISDRKGDPAAKYLRERYNRVGDQKEIPLDMLEELIEKRTQKAVFYKELGFDMVNLYMSYRSSILATSLSPDENFRTDKYGGSLENRARLTIDLCKSIKEACGQDFLIEAQVTGQEASPGYTIGDLCKYAKMWEGYVDILQIRDWDGTFSHPTGFNSQKKYPQTLEYAAAIKKSGAKIVVTPVGGFQDLDLNEEYIASGKCDMVTMARAFICDPEYGKKAKEGRGEDVVPCIRCNKCHGEYAPYKIIQGESWLVDVCSVNPKNGIAYRADRMVDPPTVPRKVAVIGGGPAGMRAAIFAAERGHKITLYERSDSLGGQLRHADFASWQWPVKDYKDYLIRQLDKHGVEVLLKTKATPKMIKEKGYEVVMAATGADPIIPDIPGADGSNVLAPIFVFGNKTLGKNVVVVGGNVIGVQAGIYLAQNGHNVVMLTNESTLGHDATPVHYYSTMELMFGAMSNFRYITNVNVTGISKDKVNYVTARDEKKFLQADNVVISAGRESRKKEAQEFYGTADQFFSIGDCDRVGMIPGATRTAFAAASQI